MAAKRWLDPVLIVLTSLGYFVLAVTPRYATVQLLSIAFTLFVLYFLVMRFTQEEKLWWWASIWFRVQFLFFIPLLSDDFYRFIWDGRLLAAGFNPFAALPSVYVSQNIPGITQALFDKLNSPQYFTVYPPIAQGIFYLAAKISPGSIAGSVFVMKVFLIGAETGSIFLIRNLLQHYQLPMKNGLLYALNPLVILELAGNLHFEALMILGLLVFAWGLVKSRWLISALGFVAAIGAKLLPFMLLPFLFYRLRQKNFWRFGMVAAVLLLALFLPWLNADFIAGITNGVGYYFKKFEFNASIYYLVREYGFWKYGYNIIQTVGWKLGVLTALGTFLYAAIEIFVRRESNPHSSPTVWSAILFSFTLYFLLSTTVHPWYLTSIVAFSVFTSWRYSVFWSALILLTYSGYTPFGYHENYYLILIEYGFVAIFFVFEYISSTRRKKSNETVNSLQST